MSFLQELYKYTGNEANRTSNALFPTNHKKKKSTLYSAGKNTFVLKVYSTLCFKVYPLLKSFSGTSKYKLAF